jgi:cobalt-zinc-cadmium efflux system outer membrane protein
MYLRYCCAAAIAALGMGGCAQQPYNDDAAWPPPRPLGKDLEVFRPPAKLSETVPVEIPVPPKPTGAITLRRALALALAHHPGLHGFAWEVRAAEARVLQAGLRPNPELEMEFENFAGSRNFSGTQSLETTLSLAQTFPLGGDIERRRELAGLQAQMAGWDYESARLEVLTEVTQHYVALLGAQRKIRLARESLTLAEQVRNATDRRIRAGDAPPIDAARASVPVATAQVELKRAERQLQAARRQLALMWSSRETDFDVAEGSLDSLRTPPPPERLAALVSENPQVARWAVEISARRAEAELAKAEAIPDINARAGVKYDNADDAGALVLGISLPLPVFDQRQGDVLAARLSANAATEQRRAAERRVEAALSQAYTRMSTGFDEAVAIRDVALPPAREAFRLTHRTFEKGDLALIDVLDAERTLVELRSDYLDALIDYHLAVTEIEGLIGQPLTRIDAASIPESRNKEGEHP